MLTIFAIASWVFCVYLAVLAADYGHYKRWIGGLLGLCFHCGGVVIAWIAAYVRHKPDATGDVKP